MSHESPRRTFREHEPDAEIDSALAELKEISDTLPAGEVSVGDLSRILQKQGIHLGPQARFEEIQHFALTGIDRLRYFYDKYPGGMKIDSSLISKKLDWASIVWREMRVLKNFYQPLTTLQRRGGLGLEEIWTVLHDADRGQAPHASDEQIIQYLSDNNYLAKT